ncbi:MAG: hypothetical protein NT170_00040 [Candidatus Moranbacteria bacterium]|nr:hypothetical protein [Candidatus Moranbacteria bacterium]
MKRYLWLMVALMMATVMLGAGTVSAGKYVYGQNATREAAYDAQMADLKAKTAVVAAIAAKAAADQDYWLNLISYIPPIGVTMAWYNAGEMDYMAKSIMAMRAGKSTPWGNASIRGVLNVLFKVPAGALEGMFTYGVNRLFTSRWNELDVFNVFTEYGRPYWVDGAIIGTKVFFGFAGAGAFHSGFPFVSHYAVHHSSRVVLPVLAKAGPVGNAFLWMAAGGGSANILAGAGSQFFTGAYCKYQPRLIWFNSRNPLPANGL